MSEHQDEMCHVPVHIGIELPNSSEHYTYETIISAVVPISATTACDCKYRHVDFSKPGAAEAMDHIGEEAQKWAINFMRDKPENSAEWSWDLI